MIPTNNVMREGVPYSCTPDKIKFIPLLTQLECTSEFLKPSKVVLQHPSPTSCISCHNMAIVQKKGMR
jgi:hypothetical protein